MARKIIFTVRLSTKEREMLNQVAATLKTTAGDAIRLLIQSAASIARKQEGSNDGEKTR